MPKYEQPKEGVAITKEVGGKEAPAGLWRHPGSGEEAITQHDPLFGNAMSQGFKRLGFNFIREAEPGEVKTLPELAMEARKESAGDLKGLTARLERLEDNKDQLEAENQKLREQLAAANPEATLSGDHAKENAEKATAEREEGDRGEVAEDTKPTKPTKPLRLQNRSELEASASALGVEDPTSLEKYETKSKLLEAVEAKLAEGDGEKEGK